MTNRYIDAFKRLNIQLKPIINKYKKSKYYFLVNAAYCFIRYGVTPNQYIGFSFYKLSHLEKKQYYTARQSRRLEKKLNDPEFYDIFWDKRLFNEYFSEYIKREWIYTPGLDITHIMDFIDRHKKVIIKPTALSSGRGIHVVDRSKFNDKDFEKLAENYKEQKFLIEAYINQHNELNKLNPTSVNTVRIYTVLNKNADISFISASLRIGGKGADVDNFHAGGVGYSIDIDTGYVCKSGYDIMGNEYLIHPSTNKRVIGFEIPNWKECLNFVSSANKLVPTARLIAWDVAILENGFEMVEANYDGDPNLMQAPAKEGKKRMILRNL